MSEFSQSELLRYSRHLVMPEIGMAGQAKLKAASVLCVGVGGLGSPAALYLAAAGVGRLGLVDEDTVDLSNLQRQVLYRDAEVGQSKVALAAKRLSRLNPEIDVEPFATHLNADNVMDIIAGFDLIIDGSDNFPTRYLVNDAAVLSGKPVVYGSVLRFDGQLSVFGAPGGPCYRCVFPDPPAPGAVPNCAEGGVLGVLPGIIGSMQALEAVKLIAGRGEPMIGRLLLFDGLAMRSREITAARNPGCPVCGDAPTITAPVATPVTDTCTAPAEAPLMIEPEALAAALEKDAPPLVLDVRNPPEFDIVRFDGAVELPLGELERRCDRLDVTCHYVIVCHKGGRAALAYELLKTAGFERIEVLNGGIDAWAARVRTDLARYR